MQNHRPGSTAPTAHPQADLTEPAPTLTLVDRIRHRARYCATTRHGLIRDVNGWCIVTTDVVFDACRRMIRDLAVDAPPADAQRLGRLSTIKAVLAIARTDRALALTRAEADALMRSER